MARKLSKDIEKLIINIALFSVIVTSIAFIPPYYLEIFLSIYIVRLITKHF